MKAYTDLEQSKKLAEILPLENADMSWASTGLGKPFARTKVFRIIKNELSEEGTKAFHPLWYRIEQRYTLLFFFHWWGTPFFEPPHLFNNDCDAMRHIKEHCPNAIVYDYYSENKCKINKKYETNINC